MSLTHHEADELLAAHVLGAVSIEEAAAVQEHLSRCPECRDTAARLQATADALALSAPPVSPTADLGARILAAARTTPTEAATASRPTAAPPPAAPVSRNRRPWRLAGLALAASLIVGLTGWNISLQLARAPAQAVTSPAVPVATRFRASNGAGGEVVTLPGHSGAVVVLENLAPAPAGHIYELWLVPASGAPQPAGVFEPTSTGNRVLVLSQSLGDVRAIAVSVEPASGSRIPTTTPFMDASV